MVRILKEGIFDSTRTLEEEIEQLSDPKIKVENERVANLVVKYLVNFSQKGGLENKRISESDVNNSYSRVQSQIGSGLLKTMIGAYFGTTYQERMLSCPSSINIVRDIINNPLKDILGNKSHFVIDAGSGSGILQTAFYIQARRSGLYPSVESSRGIELNGNAQKISNAVLGRLGIGHVIHGNSLNSENYTSLGTDFIHSFGNENIVDAMNDVRGEPFIQNLELLYDVFGEKLSQTQIFPYHILFMTPTSVTRVLNKEGIGDDFNDLINALPMIAFTGNVHEFLSKIKSRVQAAIKESGSDSVSGMFFPSDIQLTPNSEMIFLEELGHEWVGTLFEEHPGVQRFPFNNSTRWSVLMGEYMKSIPHPKK